MSSSLEDPLTPFAGRAKDEVLVSDAESVEVEKSPARTAPVRKDENLAGERPSDESVEDLRGLVAPSDDVKEQQKTPEDCAWRGGHQEDGDVVFLEGVEDDATEKQQHQGVSTSSSEYNGSTYPVTTTTGNKTSEVNTVSVTKMNMTAPARPTASSSTTPPATEDQHYLFKGCDQKSEVLDGGPVIAQKKQTLYAKTKMCRFQRAGICRYGANCNYAHSEEDLRQLPNFAKTSFCKMNFNGGCRRADCPFAHTISDLRLSPAPRQRLCLFYHGSNASCIYGKYCRYLHEVSQEWLKAVGLDALPRKHYELVAFNNSIAEMERQRGAFCNPVSGLLGAGDVDMEIVCPEVGDEQQPDQTAAVLKQGMLAPGNIEPHIRSPSAANNRQNVTGAGPANVEDLELYLSLLQQEEARKAEGNRNQEGPTSSLPAPGAVEESDTRTQSVVSKGKSKQGIVNKAPTNDNESRHTYGYGGSGRDQQNSTPLNWRQPPADDLRMDSELPRRSCGRSNTSNAGVGLDDQREQRRAAAARGSTTLPAATRGPSEKQRSLGTKQNFISSQSPYNYVKYNLRSESVDEEMRRIDASSAEKGPLLVHHSDVRRNNVREQHVQEPCYNSQQVDHSFPKYNRRPRALSASLEESRKTAAQQVLTQLLAEPANSDNVRRIKTLLDAMETCDERYYGNPIPNPAAADDVMPLHVQNNKMNRRVEDINKMDNNQRDRMEEDSGGATAATSRFLDSAADYTQASCNNMMKSCNAAPVYDHGRGNYMMPNNTTTTTSYITTNIDRRTNPNVDQHQLYDKYNHDDGARLLREEKRRGRPQQQPTVRRSNQAHPPALQNNYVDLPQVQKRERRVPRRSPPSAAPPGLSTSSRSYARSLRDNDYLANEVYSKNAGRRGSSSKINNMVSQHSTHLQRNNATSSTPFMTAPQAAAAVAAASNSSGSYQDKRAAPPRRNHNQHEDYGRVLNHGQGGKTKRTPAFDSVVERTSSPAVEAHKNRNLHVNFHHPVEDYFATFSTTSSGLENDSDATFHGRASVASSYSFNPSGRHQGGKKASKNRGHHDSRGGSVSNRGRGPPSAANYAANGAGGHYRDDGYHALDRNHKLKQEQDGRKWEHHPITTTGTSSQATRNRNRSKNRNQALTKMNLNTMVANGRGESYSNNYIERSAPTRDNQMANHVHNNYRTTSNRNTNHDINKDHYNSYSGGPRGCSSTTSTILDYNTARVGGTAGFVHPSSSINKIKLADVLPNLDSITEVNPNRAPSGGQHGSRTSSNCGNVHQVVQGHHNLITSRTKMEAMSSSTKELVEVRDALFLNSNNKVRGWSTGTGNVTEVSTRVPEPTSSSSAMSHMSGMSSIAGCSGACSNADSPVLNSSADSLRASLEKFQAEQEREEQELLLSRSRTAMLLEDGTNFYSKNPRGEVGVGEDEEREVVVTTPERRIAGAPIVPPNTRTSVVGTSSPGSGHVVDQGQLRIDVSPLEEPHPILLREGQHHCAIDYPDDRGRWRCDVELGSDISGVDLDRQGNYHHAADDDDLAAAVWSSPNDPWSLEQNGHEDDFWSDYHHRSSWAEQLQQTLDPYDHGYGPVRPLTTTLVGDDLSEGHYVSTTTISRAPPGLEDTIKRPHRPPPGLMFSTAATSTAPSTIGDNTTRSTAAGAATTGEGDHSTNILVHVQQDLVQ
ncbi:unnamed protein product [Amoebophrya sp. A25]|nr:unnamed protein product [Amoebophrya sp. A25]|eukprot:GSA25T00011829001.1